MKLERLRQMRISELAGRSLQEASKRLERMGVAGKRKSRLHAILKKPRSAGTLLNDFQKTAPVHFFEGIEGEQFLAIAAKQMPDFQDSVIAVAETVRHKRFDLLGYRGLYFGDPIDWHLDPISGKRSPRVHWSRIDPLDPDTVGDSKIIWELNRHQWFVRLGQAYFLTGDERYAETFVDAIQDWIEANPRGIGINWASSLEAALRIISWSWALCLFRRSENLCQKLFATIVMAIRNHAIHVEKYLSYYFSPNTHLTGEALGLFYAGVLFPELSSAQSWRALGEKILLAQIERQVYSDGVYFEQSTCYQRYTVEIYLHFLVLAKRNGLEVPAAVAEHVRRMVDFLVAVRGPDGSIPQIGDADGGWLLPLARRAPADFRGIFATAAAYFGRADYAWAASGPAPEVFWLLGKAGLEAFASLKPRPPEAPGSRHFSHGGYAVMRSGWSAGAHHLIFDVGPLGCPISAGHGHADLLSIQCSVFGEPYLVDPGTYCYTAEREWRDFFRGTAAHTAVLVDGVGQAVSTGPFRWGSQPHARLCKWLSTASYDFADAEHDAYCKLPDPVKHRRRVIFIKPKYWILIDDLSGQAEHRVELQYQFAPLYVALEADNWARAQGKDGHGLLIKSFALTPLRAAIVEGEISPIQGWVSPDYGRRQPAPLLIYSASTELPLTVVTLLLPIENASGPLPGVSLLVDESFSPAGVVFEGGESVLFHEGSVTIEGR